MGGGLMSYSLLDSFCLPGGQFEVVPSVRQLDNYIHLSGVRKSDSEVSHSMDPTVYHLPRATHTQHVLTAGNIFSEWATAGFFPGAGKLGV